MTRIEAWKLGYDVGRRAACDLFADAQTSPEKYQNGFDAEIRAKVIDMLRRIPEASWPEGDMVNPAARGAAIKAAQYELRRLFRENAVETADKVVRACMMEDYLKMLSLRLPPGMGIPNRDGDSHGEPRKAAT